MLGDSNSLRRNLIVLVVTSPWWLFALMRILSLDVVWPLIPAVAFTPWVTAGVVIPLIIALLFRAKWMLLVLVGLTAVLVGLMAPRAIKHDQPDVHGQKVRIFSANLLHGSANPELLTGAIKQCDPDIVALQEATPENVQQLRDAGILGELRYVEGDPEFGTLGYVTFSRWPLKRVTYPPWPTYRVLGKGFLFRNIHPAPPVKPGGPTSSWHKALSGIAPTGLRTPRIVVGDFNATLDHRSFRTVLGRGYHDAGRETGKGFEWTWAPGPRPFKLTIDHVIFDERAAVSDYRVFDLTPSDHNAIAATVTLP